MVMTASSGGTCRSETQTLHLQAVERVVAEMGHRLYDGFTLDEMADVAVMSPYHFNRVFRQTSGIPPVQFFGALRLQEAKRLLLGSQLSVTEVCFEVGYNSLGTFTRRFGELVGLSPGRFRSLLHPTEEDRNLEQAHGALQVLRRPYPLGSLESQAGGVLGRVAGPEGFTGPVFLGLFADAIPQGRPLSCTVLRQPGPFHLRGLPDGRYYLFAIGLGWMADRTALLLGDAALRCDLGHSVVLHNQRMVEGNPELTLRPPGPIDPPLLLTLPVLIRERVESWRRRAAAG